ncbi:hypothetical protein Acr_08g0005240 [Actinidia rufa]|uniref:Uncharacterized protein n=1 Tax=Actinidia rufa TaxID=165716 RepID=A0A7J0F0A9_9ERIC|nr:hypothetical protein Acr_08g0005240 [Actinidia rufa]
MAKNSARVLVTMAVFLKLAITVVQADHGGLTKKCITNCTYQRPVKVNVNEGDQNKNGENNEWDIKKKLSKNDIRWRFLTIPGEPFNQKILHKMTQTQQERLNAGRTLKINVTDVDTPTPRTYVMMLKREKNALRLQDKWTYHFVERRGLKVNDEIGLNWTNVRMDFTKFA